MRTSALPLGILAACLFGLTTSALGLALAVNVSGSGLGEEKWPNEVGQTFAIETFVSRTYNYLDNMVDNDGLPYFNIFWTDPAEAAHDWPDFGDVMSRQLQAAIMARHLTGREAHNEKRWTKKVRSYLDPATGLLMRPKTSFSEPLADLGDQALTLYALVTVYADTKDPELKPAIDSMVGDVERMLRNQFVESQLADGSWLRPGNKPDTEQFTWRDVGARMVGGYSRWTSPTHILAAREELHWGGPELRGKARAIQNCCGGSGTQGFFIAWKNASRFENSTLSIHLHIDKLLPQAVIRSYQPYKGLLSIDLKQPCKVRVRISTWMMDHWTSGFSNDRPSLRSANRLMAQ